MELIADRLYRLLAALLRFYLRPFDRVLGGVQAVTSTTGQINRLSERFRDERIAKIDAARENLEEALAALGRLKSEAEQNKLALAEALRRLDETKAGHAREAQQLEQIRAIAEADVSAFRRLAGINPARERLVGFLGGVVASLLAAGLWKLGELIFA